MLVFNPFTGTFDNVSDPATTTIKGVVKLANDLGGTALLPTVTNLHLSADTAIGHKLTSVSDGTLSGDAVNLGQLSAAIEGRLNKDPAMWGTTGNVTLSGLGTQANGEWTGTLSAGTRILVKSQSASADDGVYLAASGAWTRSLDTNTGAEITNASVLVLLGATLTGDTFTQTATVTTIGTDPQTWTQTGEGATYTADGTSITQTGTQFSRNALTGDVTAPAGSSVTTLKNTGPGATGPLGSSSTAPVVTIDAQGRVTALSSTTITPAAIGAPAGSGTSSGTNTGDQTITLTSDVTGSGTGSFATTIKSNVGLAGSPTTTTQSQADNSTKIATTAYVDIGLATKQATGNYLTALTGDVTASGPGSATATLANANGGGATVGSSTQIPVITYDIKGRITSTTTAAPTVDPAFSWFLG